MVRMVHNLVFRGTAFGSRDTVTAVPRTLLATISGSLSVCPGELGLHTVERAKFNTELRGALETSGDNMSLLAYWV